MGDAEPGAEGGAMGGFGRGFGAGLVVDGIEEPAFADASLANSPFDWANFPEIPPVLAIRFRPATEEGR